MKLVIQSCDSFDTVMGRVLDAETLKVLKLDKSAEALVCSNFEKYASTIMFNCRGVETVP